MSATTEAPQGSSTFITLESEADRDTAIVDLYIAEPGHGCLFLDATDKHMIANHLAPHLALVAVSPYSHYATLFIREAGALPVEIKLQLNHLLALIRAGQAKTKLVISCPASDLTDEGMLVVPAQAHNRRSTDPGSANYRPRPVKVRTSEPEPVPAPVPPVTEAVPAVPFTFSDFFRGLKIGFLQLF